MICLLEVLKLRYTWIDAGADDTAEWY
jgi:hypothetical protein